MTARPWATPFGEVHSFFLVCSMISEAELCLRLRLEDHKPFGDPPADPAVPRLLAFTSDSRAWTLTYPRFSAYRVVSESWYTKFAPGVELSGPGNSWILEGAPWFAELEQQPLFSIHFERPIHTFFLTSHHFIEVISDGFPTIEAA
jgi:hypothetical protein